MQKRMFGMTTVAVCVWTLSLLTAPGAHAQGQQPKVIAQAKAGTNPFVMVLADNTKGLVGIDDKATQSYTSLLAGTDWAMLDNYQLVISKGQNAVLSAGFLTDTDHTVFLMHDHSDAAVVDGWVSRSSSDPSQGWADLFITLFAKDRSSSITIVYSTPLTFAAAAKR